MPPYVRLHPKTKLKTPVLAALRQGMLITSEEADSLLQLAYDTWTSSEERSLLIQRWNASWETADAQIEPIRFDVLRVMACSTSLNYSDASAVLLTKSPDTAARARLLM